MQNLTARKQSELAFHNERFATEESDGRAGLNRWYAAVGAGSQRQLDLIAELGRDRSVLEYGCADGRFSLVEHSLTRTCGRFHGIDLSDRAIARARDTARSLGLRQCHFEAMDAEHMTFEDETFDLVFGRGIIHHLDLVRAFAEIRRVLRPQGVAVFYEPMGHNPLLNNFRKRTPDLRPPDEHPLLTPDFKLARNFFSRVETHYYGLTTIGPAALPEKSPLRDPLMRVCEQVDDVLVQLPLVGKNAWFVLLTLTK
jgi:SAM-dependent methyltransferase